jgi:hypothetical protein
MALGGGGGGGSGGAIRAGRAYVEFSGKDAGLRTFMSGLQKRLKATSAAFMSMGAGMVISGLARLAPMIGAVGTLQDLGKMKDAADALSMTGEAASGLFGVLAANGGDFKEDLEGIVQFSGRIREALAGVGGSEGQAAQLFKGLSVSAKELEGVPLDEQFYRVLGAIRELPQEQQAFKLGLVGGTDSMKKWLPLLARSADETRRMAQSLGMTEEELTKARDASRAYQQALATLSRAWQQIALAVAPVVELVSKWISQTLGPLSAFIKENKEAVILFVGTSAATVALGIAFIGLGVAINAGLAILTGLGVALSFIASPLGIAVAGVVALAAGFVYLMGVGSAFGDTMRGVKDALSAGNLGLAWRVGLAGMRAEWARLVENLTTLWLDFSTGFQEGWASAVYLFKSVWADGLESVGTGFTGLLSHIKTNYAGLFDFIFEQWAKVEEFLGNESVAEGLRLMAKQPAEEFDRTMRDVDRDIKADAQQRRNDASKELDAARERIRAENAGRLAGVAAARQAADQVLLNLRAGAAIAASFRGGGAGAGAGNGPPNPNAAMGAVRGMFAGFGNLAQSLGGGGPTREVTKRLDKVIEKTDEEIRVMEDVARQLGNVQGGVVWGV